MPRLYVGTYILDSADSGNTSTTAGVQLDAGEVGSPVITQIGAAEFRWPVMYAIVTAASEAALKTAVDAVVAALRNCAGQTVKYEETNSTTLWEMHANIWPKATCELNVQHSDLTAEIEFQVVGANAGQLASGAGDVAGLTGDGINWQYQQSAGGIAGMVAIATFGPTLSGTTVTSGARQNAVAWINLLRNTANYPAWLDTAFRMVDAVCEFDQKPNQSSVGESSYDPCTVTLQFLELQDALAASSAFSADVVRAAYAPHMVRRGALNSRAGALPGYDVMLAGDFVLKTEGSTTFNASDTSLADNAIYQKAVNVADAIITVFQTIYGANLQLVRYGSPEIDVNPVDGACMFRCAFAAGVSVFEWDENTVVRNVHMKAFSRATDGGDWVYEPEGGPTRIVEHHLRIVAASPTPYKPPPLGADWSETEAMQEPRIALTFENGAAQYVTTGGGVWRYVNPGPGNNGYSRTRPATRDLPITGIGAGVL